MSVPAGCEQWHLAVRFAGDRLAWIPGLAVDADLAAIPGEPAAHVALVPFPVPSARKVARLENPEDPRGDLS